MWLWHFIIRYYALNNMKVGELILAGGLSLVGADRSSASTLMREIASTRGSIRVSALGRRCLATQRRRLPLCVAEGGPAHQRQFL